MKFEFAKQIKIERTHVCLYLFALSLTLIILGLMVGQFSVANAQGSPGGPGSGGPGSGASTPQQSLDVFCKDGKSIKTAFGCLPIDDFEVTVAGFLRLSFGLAGGIALIMISIAAFMVMSSQAEPQRLQSAQGLIFAAISGLLVIILSVFLMRFLGVQVLGLF